MKTTLIKWKRCFEDVFLKNVMSKNILLISFQVAIIYACAGLVRNTVYSYLPLYLIERLQFAKVNIVSVFATLFNLHIVRKVHNLSKVKCWKELCDYQQQ